MLRFRNIQATPEDPVDTWGTEGILAALERGTIFHWIRIKNALPSGNVLKELNEALALCSRPAAKTWMQDQLELLGISPEQKVARKLNIHRLESGLSRQDFAKALGTSPSRLSTYLSGKVTPSAVIMELAAELKKDDNGFRIFKK